MPSRGTLKDSACGQGARPARWPGTGDSRIDGGDAEGTMKRLLFFFDGTWNVPNGRADVTNVSF